VVASNDGIGLHVEEDETNMFGVGASMEESSQALVTRKLSLFWRLAIFPPMCANPLPRWKTHDGQFLNVGFLAKQVLWIQRSQIETKKIFSLVDVLIILRRCHFLQVQNWN
jgi:hypothetical protein